MATKKQLTQEIKVLRQKLDTANARLGEIGEDVKFAKHTMRFIVETIEDYNRVCGTPNMDGADALLAAIFGENAPCSTPSANS